jgi:hypothetical protein
LGSDRRARRHSRAQDFGARHPRLAFVIICALQAGVIAVCGYQLSYGTYLGHGWVIAALAGMAAAAGLSAAVLVSNQRQTPAAGRVLIAWLVLSLASASGIAFPFPQGPYGSVVAFLNVLHAALLGYEAVVSMAVIALLAYVLLRPRGHARSRAARRACAGPCRAPRQAQVLRTGGGDLAGRAPDRRGRHGDVAVPEGRRRGGPHLSVPGAADAAGGRSPAPAPEDDAGHRQRPGRGRRQPQGARGAAPQSSSAAVR